VLDELKDIERELERLKKRVRRMIQLLEKRQVRLTQLGKEDVLGEIGSRTLPATDIAELMASADKPRKKP